MLTLDDAYNLAREIKQKSSKIYSVELFGSVLAQGKGHDVDLMLIVDDELSQRFWPIASSTTSRWPMPPLSVRRLIKKFLPFLDQTFTRNKKARHQQASMLLGFDINPSLDVWLMPQDWRSRVDSLTDSPNMRRLLKEAARSAIPIV